MAQLTEERTAIMHTVMDWCENLMEGSFWFIFLMVNLKGFFVWVPDRIDLEDK